MQRTADAKTAPAQLLTENVAFTDLHPSAGDRRSEILEGLRAPRKSINPKYFYDERGSRLFEAITRLPEYYPTRTEARILSDNAAAIASACGPDCLLIEPGSGNCEKVRYLLDAVAPKAYVPIDISADFLQQAARDLAGDYPGLAIHAVCADFSAAWQATPSLPAGRRIIFYPGSTIGNLQPDEAREFLAGLQSWMGSAGGALVGVDLHKSAAVLNAAYNDSEGITAEFNLNILRHINTVVDAEFDPDDFQHRAFYDSDRQRIEMHLVSRRDQSVPCNGATIELARGETIQTEYSYKYTVPGFQELASSAGLTVRQSWLDDRELFSVHYLEPRRA
jgi:dimethylhistidine N-methyltransferase